MDAPYSSYSTGSGNLTNALSGCSSTNSGPGLYDNALNDLGFVSVNNFMKTPGVKKCYLQTQLRIHGSQRSMSIHRPLTLPTQAMWRIQLNNAVCLSGCTDTKTCPGVYDNALNDLGDTPFFVYVLRCQK